MSLYISPKLRFFCSFIFLLLIASGPLSAEAQSSGDAESVSIDVTREELQNKIDSVTVKQGLDEALKNRLIKLYESAQVQLDDVQWFQMLEATFQDSLIKVPNQLKELETETDRLKKQLASFKVEGYSKSSSEELKQWLALEQGKLSDLNSKIKKLEDQIATQINRPDQIRQEKLKAIEQIESARERLKSPHSETESKLEVEARNQYLNTLISARTIELKALEMEAISNLLRVSRLKAKLLLLELKRKGLMPVIHAMDDAQMMLRQQEAEKLQEALSQAEFELLGKPPVVQQLTRENIQYSKDLKIITEKTEKFTNKRELLEERISAIENDFKSAEKKISLAGLSPVLGKVLREQRRNLALESQAYLSVDAIQEETALTGLAQFNVESRLKEIMDIESELKHLMDEVDSALSSDEKLNIQFELRQLLNNQTDLLNQLSSAYLTFLRTLGDHSFAREQLLNRATKFTDYLDERLLWVPSSPPVNASYLLEIYRSLKWLNTTSNWVQVQRDFARHVKNQPFLTGSVVIVLFVLGFSKTWIKRRLREITIKVEKPYTDHFIYTLQAFAYTFILTAPLPVIFFFTGWLLTSGLYAGDFSKAVGEGLQSASIPLFFLQLFYYLFSPEGIVKRHFLWSEDSVRLMRRLISIIRLVAVPAIFLIDMTRAYPVEVHSDNLGRFALMITTVMMSYILGRLLHPGKGLVRGYIQSRPKSWIFQLRYVWYPIAIIIPLVVFGFAITGYYLSALELQQKLIITLRFIFVTIIIHELVVRWLTTVNRQLALKNARQKRKAKAAELSAKKSSGSSEEPVLDQDLELLDIPKINAQTLKLLNVAIGISLIIGFWITWEDILPAFSFVDNVVLWSHVVMVDQQETVQPIVLTNLLLAGFYTFITIVAVRNCPGFMEVVIYRRFAMDSGSRYAFNQIAQYFLITIGFIVVASKLGGSWSKVQWLVAALSVGLGFGLQEIFANLVSGIILLFERPVRIGDTVTVGDVTGKVSKIQMRATRIIDWDQKELVIPNKSIITGQLVNWSLSSPVTRIVIPVGISYGSDVEMAYEVISDTVKTTPNVLSDPEPCVYFIGFGESSLDFSIRVYVDELNQRLPLTHDLHLRINQALRDHHIEIPFPQRDIHIRSGSQTAS